jgi:hypothetical protein
VHPGLTLTGAAPSAEISVLERPLVGGLTLDPQTPTIGAGVSPDADALLLAGVAPSSEIDHFKTNATKALVLNSDAINVIVGKLSQPTVGSLLLASAGNPSSEIDHFKTNATKALVLNSDAVNVIVGQLSQPTTGSLLLAGIAPSAEIDHFRSVPVGSALLAGIAPNLGTSVSPTVGGLLFGSDASSAEITHNKTPGTIGLTLNGIQPVIVIGQTVAPDATGLLLTGAAPDLGGDSGDVVRDPLVGSLTLTGQTPGVGSVVKPAAGDLQFSGLVTPPSAEIDHFRAMSLATLQLNSDAVSVDITALVEPSTGSLALSGIASTILAITTIPTGSLVLESRDGGIDVDITHIKAVSGDALAFSSDAPSVSVGATVLPTVGSVALLGIAPIVGRSVAPDSGALVLATTTVTLDAEVSPDGLILSGTTPGINVANAGVALVNTDATVGPNHYEQCDLTGFRQMPGSLKLQWNKYAVRKK